MEATKFEKDWIYFVVKLTRLWYSLLSSASIITWKYFQTADYVFNSKCNEFFWSYKNVDLFSQWKTNPNPLLLMMQNTVN